MPGVGETGGGFRVQADGDPLGSKLTLGWVGLGDGGNVRGGELDQGFTFTMVTR